VRSAGVTIVAAGFTNVRRYQLDIPTWWALVGLTQIDREGIRYVLDGDRMAVLFDARGAEEFKAGSLPSARNLVLAEVVKAKDDGRLPMEDHNTRIIVVGQDGAQARAVAEAIIAASRWLEAQRAALARARRGEFGEVDEAVAVTAAVAETQGRIEKLLMQRQVLLYTHLPKLERG
jgi:rhodanese-related sulfurtransferase